MFKSYEMMNCPVVSPTVIGSEMSPGVAITEGNETVTVGPKVASATSLASAFQPTSIPDMVGF